MKVSRRNLFLNVCSIKLFHFLLTARKTKQCMCVLHFGKELLNILISKVVARENVFMRDLNGYADVNQISFKQ